MAVAVMVMHPEAEFTGVSPPIVRQVCGGKVMLKPTASHPGGEGMVTCGECHAIFDVYMRTASELKEARRAQRRKFNAAVIPVALAFLCSFMLAVLFAAACGSDKLAEAFKYGTWAPLSATGFVVTLLLLSSQFFVRTPKVALEPRTPAGPHSTYIENIA